MQPPLAPDGRDVGTDTAPVAPSGDPGLKRLIYASRSTLVQTDLALNGLLCVAQPRNRQDDICALLLHVAGRFLQCLEGPAPAVDKVYARIRLDPRHHGLVVLADEPIVSRLFVDCDMASLSIEPRAWHRLMTAAWPALPATATATGAPSGLDMLVHLWQGHRRRDRSQALQAVSRQVSRALPG